MKNTLTIVSIIIFFIAGLVIEDQFDLMSTPSESEVKVSETFNRPQWPEEFEIVQIKSPLDKHLQAAYFYKSRSVKPQPLIVSLHTWSANYTQYDSINEFSLEKDFNYIHPNFRGANNHKDACCSDLVISDIDAAIDYALNNANVDTSRIYVVGQSGGGYATLALFMKSKHRIKKFSSWVPLVDLEKWYEETKIRKLKYANEILLCTASENGLLNKELARQKSPINWETPIDKLKYAQLDIYTGIYDGMMGNGSIPITHSINFYNKLLSDMKIKDEPKYVTDDEKLALLESRKTMGEFGRVAGREIILIKESNNVRLTLFEGGHEILSTFAFEELIK